MTFCKIYFNSKTQKGEMSRIRLVSNMEQWIEGNQIKKVRKYIQNVSKNGFAKHDFDRTYNEKYACIHAVKWDRIEILRLLLKHAELLLLDLTYDNYAAIRYACYNLKFELVNVFLVHCSPNVTKSMLKYVCVTVDSSKKLNLIKFILNHQKFDPTLSAHETLFYALMDWNKEVTLTLLKDPRLKRFTSDCVSDAYPSFISRTFDDWIYQRFKRDFQVYATVLCLRRMDSISDDIIKNIVNFI